MARIKGIVSWFNAAKGFGFLTQDGGNDVFVHYSALPGEGYKSLKEGQAVEYDVILGSRGKPQADKVVLVSAAPHTDGG